MQTEKRLNVLVLSAEPPYPPTHGGARLKLYNLLKYLSAFHNLTLLTLLESHEERELLAPLEAFCRRIIAYPHKRWERPSLRQRFQALTYWYYDEQAAEGIRRELQTQRYDLIHVDTVSMLVYTPLLRGHCKIIASHDCATLAHLNKLHTVKGLKHKLRARYDLGRIRAMEKKFCAEYDGCVLVAERDKEVLQQLCPHLHISIVPNGIDLEYFRPQVPRADDPSLLLFTGTMNYGSNSHAATWFTQEIFPRIRKSRPDARFVIAGRNPPEEVRGLAREGEIIVTGFVEDMRPLLASATVYVCPLCNGSGMKNKMLEAMAMGKAIVTTPEGISGINATHGTHLIVARTPEEFANATVSLCNNPQRREELGFAARVFVEQNYSWEHTGHLVHELYLHVMKTHTCNVTDN